MTITITQASDAKLMQNARKITVHGEPTQVDDAIREGLEVCGFAQCEGCDQWFREEHMHKLKSYRYGRWINDDCCDSCYAKAIEPHPQGCRCESCKGAKEAAAENAVQP